MGVFLDAFFCNFFEHFWTPPPQLPAPTPTPHPLPGMRSWVRGGGRDGWVWMCLDSFLILLRLFEWLGPGGGLATYTHMHYRLD